MRAVGGESLSGVHGKPQEKQEHPESAVGAILAGSDQGRSDSRRDRLELEKVASSVLRGD